MPPSYRLLIVDDEPRMCQVLQLVAERWGYDVRTANNGHAALDVVATFHPEVIVSDLKMPGMDGDELLRECIKRHPDIPIIMMTAHATVKSAVEAMKAGAFDYIMKPFNNDELRLILSRAVEVRQLKNQNQVLKRELGNRFHSDNIVGDSPGIMSVLELIDRVAPTRATALITGESGTGKELVARAIHARSPRAKEPFVALNCAALTETLLESELFGHEKGSFTGANRAHRGKFEEADGGTIFLDEIAETNNTFQTKLLRVLQDGTFERVGGNEGIKVDVRVIAATNKVLEDMVKSRTFREDLYYRLKVVPIHVPPLRERRSDIPLLAEHFAKTACQQNGLPLRRLGRDALQALANAEWRGNVRELENTIERAVILTHSEEITAADLWLPPADGQPSTPYLISQRQNVEDELFNLPLNQFIDEMTKRCVLRALERADWRKQESAERLGVDRATLYRMIKRFGLEPMESPTET